MQKKKIIKKLRSKKKIVKKLKFSFIHFCGLEKCPNEVGLQSRFNRKGLRYSELKRSLDGQTDY